jgi:hypothetical protein
LIEEVRGGWFLREILIEFIDYTLDASLSSMGIVM